MSTRKDDARKPTQEPKKGRDTQEQDLQVQELEERIAPAKLT